MQVIIEESEYKALKKKESAIVEKLSKKCEILQKQVDELKKIKFKRLYVEYKRKDFHMDTVFIGYHLDEITQLETELIEISSQTNINFKSDEELRMYLQKEFLSKFKKLDNKIEELKVIRSTPWYKKLIGRFDNGQPKKSS